MLSWFQYPLSGRRLCSLTSSCSSSAFSMTGFSTLYRVEGCAAAIPGDHRQSLHLFQYPLSGRRLCSDRRQSDDANRHFVSVPSIGSKAVQQLCPACGRGTMDCFSTLYRVEGCAAKLSGNPEETQSSVSVPSIGSKAVQPTTHCPRLALSSCFSTLYRVEGCAAQGHVNCPESPARVSVPSIGSKAVQPPARARHTSRRSVSVPSIGSKAVQLMGLWSSALGLHVFQYPLSGRRLCSISVSR